MANWFETTAKFSYTEFGESKKATEKYLVDAVSVTDAESKGIVLLTERHTQLDEAEISAAVARTVQEVFKFDSADGNIDDCRWYRCKVMYMSVDEKSGKVKRTPALMMVYGSSVEDAVASLKVGMRGTMSDWELHTVAETSIVEVVSK